jgi:1-acyl-sn-glycerol-3-phosphate acyltransferase
VTERAKYERPSEIRGASAAKGFWLARVLRVTAGKLLLVLFRVSLCGAENIPAAGGAILAGNHISYGDPVLLWCKSPRATHFMAKSGLWDAAWLGWALDHFWAFPIHRGTADREAIQVATRLLGLGELVGIFPEGTRNLDGQAEAQGGVALIAMRSNVPVIPVGIAGTEKIRPAGTKLVRFPKVTICCGTPICPDDVTGEGRKERVEAMTTEIMRCIAEQLERARSQ